MPSKTRHRKLPLLTQSSLRGLRAFARVELDMRSEEFDLLSPSDWVLLFRQWKVKQLREDLRVARICQVVAGSVGSKTALRDFLPDPPPMPKLQRKKKFKQTNPKIIERQLLALFPKANLKPQWQPTR